MQRSKGSCTVEVGSILLYLLLLAIHMFEMDVVTFCCRFLASWTWLCGLATLGLCTKRRSGTPKRLLQHSKVQAAGRPLPQFKQQTSPKQNLLSKQQAWLLLLSPEMQDFFSFFFFLFVFFPSLFFQFISSSPLLFGCMPDATLRYIPGRITYLCLLITTNVLLWKCVCIDLCKFLPSTSWCQQSQRGL